MDSRTPYVSGRSTRLIIKRFVVTVVFFKNKGKNKHILPMKFWNTTWHSRKNCSLWDLNPGTHIGLLTELHHLVYQLNYMDPGGRQVISSTNGATRTQLAGKSLAPPTEIQRPSWQAGNLLNQWSYNDCTIQNRLQIIYFDLALLNDDLLLPLLDGVLGVSGKSGAANASELIAQ